METQSRRNFLKLASAGGAGVGLALAGCDEDTEKRLEKVAEVLDAGVQEPQRQRASLTHILDNFEFYDEQSRARTAFQGVMKNKVYDGRFIQTAAEYFLDKFDVRMAVFTLETTVFDKNIEFGFGQAVKIVQAGIDRYLEQGKAEEALVLARSDFARGNREQDNYRRIAEAFRQQAHAASETQFDGGADEFNLAIEAALKVGDEGKYAEQIATEAAGVVLGKYHLSPNNAIEFMKYVKDKKLVEGILNRVVRDEEETLEWALFADKEGFKSHAKMMYLNQDEDCSLEHDVGSSDVDECISFAELTGYQDAADRYRTQREGVLKRVRGWISESKNAREAGNADEARNHAIKALSAIRRYDDRLTFDANGELDNEDLAMVMVRENFTLKDGIRILAQFGRSEALKYAESRQDELKDAGVTDTIKQLYYKFWDKTAAADLAILAGEQEIAAKIYGELIETELRRDVSDRSKVSHFAALAKYARMINDPREAEFTLGYLQEKQNNGQASWRDGDTAAKLGDEALADAIYTSNLEYIETCQKDKSKMRDWKCQSMESKEERIDKLVSDTFDPERQVEFYINRREYKKAVQIAQEIGDDEFLAKTYERASMFKEAGDVELKRGNVERAHDYHDIAHALRS